MEKAAAYKKAQRNVSRCDECHTPDVVVHNLREGTAVCQVCGSVKEDSVIDESAEWRNFGNDGSGKADGSLSNGDRTGGNVNFDLDSYGMETMITGGTGADTKLQRIANRYQTSHDRNVKAAMMSLRHYANLLNLTRQCQEVTKEIFSNAERNGRLKGKSLDSKIAAAIYMASKMCNRPKSLRELINVINCKRKDVTKCYKLLSQDLPSQRIKTNMSECVSSI